jgi:hypothetical protein
MLNSNPGVHLSAEPLSRLANSAGAADELAAIQLEVARLDNSSVGAGGEGGEEWRVTGFNEKLMSKRYQLPFDPFHFDLFKQYLVGNNFRCVVFSYDSIVFCVTAAKLMMISVVLF